MGCRPSMHVCLCFGIVGTDARCTACVIHERISLQISPAYKRTGKRNEDAGIVGGLPFTFDMASITLKK